MRMLATALMALGLAGCDFQIGPAHPERDARAVLEREGHRPAGIAAIVSGGPLAAAEVASLRHHRSRDVRFLVARNRHLTSAQVDDFVGDGDDFVRSGAAANLGLTAAQIARLAGDVSHTVRLQLAGNPSLTEGQLLGLHARQSPGLLAFAFNPNCPEVIRAEILASDDDLAKRWLEITDGWKRDGHFVRGGDGRWQRP